MRNDGIKNFALLCLPFTVSAVLLGVIQPPIGASFMAWICLVPFLLVSVKRSASTGGLMLAAYFLGVVYWILSLYWLEPVTGWGWIAIGLYLGVLWPMVAVGVRFCRMKGVPLFLAAGVLFVGAEHLQGFFLGGFYWRYLGHSQYANLPLIQIADIFGAGGVSLLVAMVNGLTAELLIDFNRARGLRAGNYFKTALVLAAVAGTVGYGYWRIGQSEDCIEQGVLAGVVQSNVPQSVKDSGQEREDIFYGLIADSQRAIEAGAELVVWPETMVQWVLSKDVIKYISPAHSYAVFDKKLAEHAKDSCYLLVGATGGEPMFGEDGNIDGLEKIYNSAFLYTPAGEQAKEQYNKIHLVPFGEEIPVKKGSWLHKFFLKFSPYEEDYTLDRGSEYTVFEMTGKNGGIYKFGVMICYEDAVPCIGLRFALDDDGKKRIDWLLNISNDGWFVDFEDSRPSSELAQHTAICVFRAVENRVAVLRSVNTGISCLIDSKGLIRDGFLEGSLPEQAMKRTGVSGWFTDRIPIDKRVTFFSRHGQWLDGICALGLVFCVILMTMGRIVRNKRKKRR